MLAWVLLRLSRIQGDDELAQRAVSVFRLVEPAIRRARARSHGRCAELDLWLSPPREIAIVGAVGSPCGAGRARPVPAEAVVAIGPSEEVPPLLVGKGLVEGSPPCTCASGSPVRPRSWTRSL